MTELNFDPRSDYFHLDDELTEEERNIRDKVRAFAQSRIEPIINDYWERGEFPEEILPDLAKINVVGTIIEGYGCPGMSRMAQGMVAREMARIDGSVNTFMGVHSNLCMGSISILGSEEQRQRWLPDLATIKKLGAFALTEPEHGSDSVALETSARREGDSWVINGHKRWIGNGHRADIIVLYARNTEDNQVNAFVVEKDDNGNYPKGYQPEAIQGKIGKRAIQQADIVIEELVIPDANRLVDCKLSVGATQTRQYAQRTNCHAINVHPHGSPS